MSETVKRLLIRGDDWRLRLGRVGLIVFGGTLLLHEAFGPSFHQAALWFYVIVTAGFGAMFVVGLRAENK